MKVAKQNSASRKRSNSGIQSEVLVIGVGNPLCGDDAAGRIVAARVRRRAKPFIRVVECSGEGADLLEMWANAGTVIVVDAVASGAEIGTVHRFEASREPLPVRFRQSSTHAFGLGEAVELARALHQLPKCLIVYGIAGRRFDMGSKPSPEVKRIIPSVVVRMLEEAASAGVAQLASSHLLVTKITDAETSAPETRD
jgi:hydrogenase maturation protease